MKGSIVQSLLSIPAYSVEENSHTPSMIELSQMAARSCAGRDQAGSMEFLLKAKSFWKELILVIAMFAIGFALVYDHRLLRYWLSH